MKIEIIKEKILSAVGICERVAGKHVSLPVLSCIVLEVKNNTLLIKATNLDIGVEATIQAKTIEEGVVAVSGTVLKSFLANTNGDGNVSIEKKENHLILKTNNSEATIMVSSPDDFPAIPKISEGKKIKISSKDFVLGAASVLYSSSVSSIKPELSSVYIYTDDDGLVFAATDSFRLAEKKIKHKKIKDENFSMLIPFKNIAEIARILNDNPGEVEIISTKNQVSFFVPGLHITSRVVDGNFPDYKQIIPKNFTSSITVLKQDLAQALKLTNTFSDHFNQVIFNLSNAKKLIEIKTKNNEVGEGSQTIKGSSFGEDLEITFNHKYVFDCLQSIESESVTLGFNGQGKPLVITPSHNGSFTYMVMPMNK